MAPATAKAYAARVRRVVSWVQARGWVADPLGEVAVVECLRALVEEEHLGVASAKGYAAAVAWFCRTRGWPDPTKGPLMRALKAGLVRMFGKEPVPKKPLGAKEIFGWATPRRLAEAWAVGDARVLRRGAILLFGYLLCLRRSELAEIRRVDMHVAQDRVGVEVCRRKTAKSGAKSLVVMPRGMPVDPLVWWERYRLAAGAVSEWAFEGLLWSGRSSGMRLEGAEVCEEVKCVAHELGLNENEYGAHSLRRAAATDEAEAGVPDRDIDRHGGWAPGSGTRERYVDQAREEAGRVGGRLAEWVAARMAPPS